MILLAKDGSGYENLCRLVTLAYENDRLAPIITKTQLWERSLGLICLSFSVVGELCTLLLEGKDEQARLVSDWYYEVFGEDYYYEIQNHGLPSEAVAMNKLLNLAYQTKIPVVLTNDCHYMDRNDTNVIDALNCIRKGIDFSHPEAKRFACNEYYFKSPKEMRSLIGFPPQLIKNTLEIADKINVTDGYISISESELSVPKVVGLLSSFSPTLRIRFKPGCKHISVSLMDHRSADVLEHLRLKIPDYDLVHFTEYESWTQRSIYSAVLNTMNVPDEKIRELCGLIPAGAKTLREAVLMSIDFSCLSSEDYVCSSALEIGDILINTFKEERPSRHIYALIPKGMPVPIAREIEGNLRCIYNREQVNETGNITIEFR